MNMLPPAVYELSPSNLLLYRTSMLALDCPNGQRILKGCFFCIVRLPCRCSITTNNLYLPPRLGKCNNQTDKVTILHPVNLALLQQFFHENSHSTIFGDTIFEELVHVKIPDFHIFNHSFSKFLANDKEQHLSLKRIAKAVKHERKGFQKPRRIHDCRKSRLCDRQLARHKWYFGYCRNFSWILWTCIQHLVMLQNSDCSASCSTSASSPFNCRLNNQANHLIPKMTHQQRVLRKTFMPHFPLPGLMFPFLCLQQS